MGDAGFSVADELAKLAALRDQGVLTDEELEAQKAKLLGAPATPPPPSAPNPTGLVDLVLLDAGPKLIQVIKEIREATGLGLKEAKDLAEHTPSAVLHQVTEEQAKAVGAAFQRVGATVGLGTR